MSDDLNPFWTSVPLECRFGKVFPEIAAEFGGESTLCSSPNISESEVNRVQQILQIALRKNPDKGLATRLSARLMEAMQIRYGPSLLQNFSIPPTALLEWLVLGWLAEIAKCEQSARSYVGGLDQIATEVVKALNAGDLTSLPSLASRAHTESEDEKARQTRSTMNFTLGIMVNTFYLLSLRGSEDASDFQIQSLVYRGLATAQAPLALAGRIEQSLTEICALSQQGDMPAQILQVFGAGSITGIMHDFYSRCANHSHENVPTNMIYLRLRAETQGNHESVMCPVLLGPELPGITYQLEHIKTHARNPAHALMLAHAMGTSYVLEDLPTILTKEICEYLEQLASNACADDAKAKFADASARAFLLKPEHRQAILNWPENSLDDLILAAPGFFKKGMSSPIAIAAMKNPALVHSLAKTVEQHLPTYTRLVRRVLAARPEQMDAIAAINNGVLKPYIERPVFDFLMNIPAAQLSMHEQLLSKFCADFSLYCHVLCSVSERGSPRALQVLSAHGYAPGSMDIYGAPNKIELARALMKIDALGSAAYSTNESSPKGAAPASTVSAATLITQYIPAPSVLTPEDEIVERLGGNATMRKRLLELKQATKTLYPTSLSVLAKLPLESQRDIISNGNRDAYSRAITSCPTPYRSSLMQVLAGATHDRLEELLAAAQERLDNDFHTHLAKAPANTVPEIKASILGQMPFSKISRGKLHHALIVTAQAVNAQEICTATLQAYLHSDEAVLDLRTRVVEKLNAGQLTKEDALTLIKLYRTDEDLAAAKEDSDLSPEKVFPVLAY